MLRSPVGFVELRSGEDSGSSRDLFSFFTAPDGSGGIDGAGVKARDTVRPVHKERSAEG